jgi:hypothetical protein
MVVKKLDPPPEDVAFWRAQSVAARMHKMELMRQAE